MAFPAPNLLYCGVYLGARSLEHDGDHAIYDLDLRGRTLFTAYVTSDTRIDISKLQNTCRKLQVLYPLDKISYEVDGVHLMALIYLPFKTLSLYLGENASRVSEPSFVGVMRGILTGLNNMHGEGCALLGQRFIVVVKQEDGQGSVMLISNEHAKRTNENYRSDFQNVKDIISVRCLGVQFPADLKMLLNCLSLGITPARRKRFLSAPFFYTAKDKINVFLVKVYYALWNCAEYKTQARSKKFWDVANKVETAPYEEVREVWARGGQNTIRDDFDLCRFIRNCVMHIDEVWRNTLNKTGISVLLSDPEQFLQFINSLSPDFLNRMFEHSYKAKYYNESNKIWKDLPSISILDN